MFDKTKNYLDYTDFKQTHRKTNTNGKIQTFLTSLFTKLVQSQPTWWMNDNITMCSHM